MQAPWWQTMPFSPLYAPETGVNKRFLNWTKFNFKQSDWCLWNEINLKHQVWLCLRFCISVTGQSPILTDGPLKIDVRF